MRDRRDAVLIRPFAPQEIPLGDKGRTEEEMGVALMIDAEVAVLAHE